MKKVSKWFVIIPCMMAMLFMVLLVSCAGSAAEEPTLTPAEEATATTHTLEGRDDCLMCHETGVGEAGIIPADHSGRTNDTCITCHKPVE